MPTLRLTQTALDDDRYRVELTLRETGRVPRPASVEVRCTFSARDREDMRWYLETYPQYPESPNPEIAARIERRMAAVGRDLFQQLFGAVNTTMLWGQIADRLTETRVEICTGVAEATAIPWELLRGPLSDAPLALEARTFVRVQSETAREVRRLELGHDEAIRILLVICRPGRNRDVPFRSVARRLIEALTEDARATYTLDVLRPPTYDRLAEVLREAKDAGRPYHVVHFDGHGAYVENPAGGGVGFMPNPLTFSDTRPGQHGYLVFEKPEIAENHEFIPGPKLGRLLYESHVPVLVLNACRSAHAEATSSPPPNSGEGPGEGVHEQVRAFGSLAQEVVDAGVAGVVAMRYNVFVVTAARFVGELYGALARGQTLGRAATYGRKRLYDDPHRDIVQPLTLHDWPVPVIYEAAPIQLFPAREAAALRLDLGAAHTAAQGGDPTLPPPPDVGFFGRDETLLAFDRAFDSENVVLLHGYAGSGKTATAAEFARWYEATGGLRMADGRSGEGQSGEGQSGPVLFTSFEHYVPLPRVLDHFGAVFDATLQASGIQWLALDAQQRVQVALMVLQQVPVLWIWDNVEPVMGLPVAQRATPVQKAPGTTAGTAEAEASGEEGTADGCCPYRADEQAALRDFLRACGGTRARVLLTSRRDEAAWLGDLPARIALPPMPRRERVQLARALARKHGRVLDLAAWDPLLRYTGGNPLTLTVVVGQALRDGLETKAQVEAYVARLRKGEDAFPDAADEGRSRSLGASLAYGFDAAFTPAERRILALLYLFQGFVDVDALRWMENDLPDLYDFWRDSSTTNNQSGRQLAVDDQESEDNQRKIRNHLIILLDKASEVGLLTAHGGGYYTIHPALPWFFRRLFATHYPDDVSRFTFDEAASGVMRQTSNVKRATRAFVEAMGVLGNHYWWQYQNGHREVVGAVQREEANLLHAWRLARMHGWFWRVTGTMQGLQVLYNQTGRRAEWRALVEAVEPDFVDPATGGPLPGREDQWSLITQYRVWLAQEVRDWAAAERLQRAQVDWLRAQVAPFPPPRVRGGGQGEGSTTETPLDAAQRNTVRSLAVSLGQLGDILREQGKPNCVEPYKEAIALYQYIEDYAAEAICAFNLGHAYMGDEVPALRDLDAAERWYRRSLDLRAAGDRLGRGKCYSQFGLVAYERFKEAKEREGEKARKREGEKAKEREGEKAKKRKSEKAKRREGELVGYLNAALGYYQQALELLPPNAVDDLAVTHNQLGNIYDDVGDVAQAVAHYNESVRYEEAQGNFYGAGQTRYNLARMLAQQGRFADALAYARAALRDYQRYQGRAAADEDDARRLIAQIEAAQRAGHE